MSIYGQNVIAPIAPDTQYIPETIRSSPNYVPPIVGNPLFDSKPFQWGPVAVRPHVLYRYLYGDGIQHQPGEAAKTSIQTLSPGIAFDFGQSWTFDYTPTWTYYSDDNFADTVDHSMVLVGAVAAGDWGFQLSQTYGHSSPTLVETGGQTKQENFVSTVTLTYQLGSRTLIDDSLDYNVQLAEGYPDSRTLANTLGFRYEFSKDFDAGISVGVGKVDRSEGSDMSFVQPKIRINWRPTEKFSLHADGGMETRKFKTDTVENMRTPILSGSVDYRPTDTTQFSFAVGRVVAASLFENQVTKTEYWRATFDQRLFAHYYFSADYGASKAEYSATEAGVVTDREDTTRTLNLRLRTTLFKRMSITAVFQESHNSSNVPGFDYSSSQIGFELGYAY